MIELRWLEYKVLIDGYTAKVEKVLQYREREGTMEEGWWGSWYDVSTEGEGGYR